ncbi:uncharacterized protein LOC106156771 [Lingula anatina]|uniref:Uncharacterized protein LOC106156771 n=1 Tax=Lingula anatina TaxID=7574 RepID=A0A1S3HRG8_LINAN|nr:uncharacterized protein LOC106156771 [Lingula anatina]|eukprot:XP_013387644.1 uncharacterized protein LOC106156771 [Lingula anatina]
MGCSSSSDGGLDNHYDEPPRKVDPRLPYTTYRQVFNLKNSWKAINRKLEDTAKDNLMRFFRKHREYQAMFPQLKDMDEEIMQTSDAFEDQSLRIFNIFDEVMEYIDCNVDNAIDILHSTGKQHARIEGFKPEMFSEMEESFMEAAKEVLGDRFTESADDNLRKLYQFCIKHINAGYAAATQ